MGFQRSGAGFLIFDRNKNVLLLKRASDSSYPLSWSLPGGSIEDVDCDGSLFPKKKYSDEEYLKCAIRETYEETDLNFRMINFKTIHKIFSSNKIHNYNYMTFIISVDSLDDLIKNINLDLKENIESKIFSFKLLKNIKRHSEKEKSNIQKDQSIHPGLFDILKESEDVTNKYFK